MTLLLVLQEITYIVQVSTFLSHKKWNRHEYGQDASRDVSALLWNSEQVVTVGVRLKSSELGESEPPFLAL